MSTQTISPIEFATNSKNHWFTVCYDWSQCQQILTQAHKLGVIPSPPKRYTYPNTRWIVYFNSGVSEQFTKWIRSTFTVQNVQRVVGAMRSEAAIKHENKIYCQRAAISKFKLSEVKIAMLNTIGTAAEIRELFDNYGIKVIGTAGLPQCLALIEELDKFDDVIAELHKPKSQPEIGTEPEPKPEPKPQPELGTELGQLFKAVDTIMSKPIYQDTAIVPYVETVEAEIVEDDEYIDLDSDEFNESMLAIAAAYIEHQQLALPAGIDNNHVSDFEPWTADELSAYTIKEIVKLAELDGIDLTGKKRARKADLIAYVLPALNAAALAAHLA